MNFRDVLFIARRHIGYLLRQRETILWTFVMPVVFFFFIGTVTGGMNTSPSAPSEPDPLALWAPADAGHLVDTLVERLEAEHYLVSRPSSREEYEAASRRLRVPDGPYGASGNSNFTDAVLRGDSVELEWGVSGDGIGLQFDQVRLARAVYGLLADLTLLRSEKAAADAPPLDLAALASLAAGGTEPNSSGTPSAAALELTPEEASAQALAAVRARPRALELDVRSAGRRQLPPMGFEQTIPGTLVMFTMLILLTSGAILLVIERQQGLLRRLAATPIHPASIVAGKTLGNLSLGLLQIGFGMIAGTLLFRMDWGSALPAVIALMFSWALFNATLGMLLGNLARTEGQMSGLGIVTTMGLAALGGCWWPIEVTPAWMQTVAKTLPTGWAMDGLHKLVSFGLPASSIVPHVAALLVSALLLGWASTRTFRYQ